jgi:uncharacterized protein (TIRG00374 family)
LFDVLKIVISLTLIIVILRSINIGALWEVVRNANLWYLLAAQGLLLFGVVVRAYRWRILVQDQGVYASLRELTALYFVGFLFNNILPSGFGGDAVKMYELLAATQSKCMSCLIAASVAPRRLVACWWIAS